MNKITKETKLLIGLAVLIVTGLVLGCVDIKSLLLNIPGRHTFVMNLNFIAGVLKKYATLIVGGLILWGIIFWRKYADIKIPSISIAGIEFNLKNIDKVVKTNLTNYFITKRSLFKIEAEHDNFDDVFESYYNIYEFIRMQMSYYENANTTDNIVYKEMKSMIKDLNCFLTANQTDYRRWYKIENAKEYKFIDQLQKMYPKYDELVREFQEINVKMNEHIQKLNIRIEW